MARPKKQKVEYFPHFVSSGRTIFILENTFGNDGYAFWFKLLEILGDSEGHNYDCNITSNWKFLLAKTRVDEVSAEKIIKTLIELGQIDENLWTKRIIWVQNFVDNLTELYRKRASNIPLKPLLDTETPLKDSFRGENTTKEGDNSAKTPQRIGKERKEKDSKEKNNNRLLLSLYEQLGFGLINPITASDLGTLEKEYTKTWVTEAMKEANDQGIRNLKYVKGILKNWKTKGFKVEKPKGKKETERGFHNFEGRDYGERYDYLLGQCLAGQATDDEQKEFDEMKERL